MLLLGSAHATCLQERLKQLKKECGTKALGACTVEQVSVAGGRAVGQEGGKASKGKVGRRKGSQHYFQYSTAVPHRLEGIQGKNAAHTCLCRPLAA